MQKLIECVPNFSEGRAVDIIRQITTAIASVDGVSLLDVDPGASTNRTVVTFVGSPDAAVEAALRAIQKAAELIDMRKHKGAHPRMGATDVCPFIPVSNVSWEEAIACAQKLGKRVGEELKIPVYLYEKAAKDKSRSNLAVVRTGEYAGVDESDQHRGNTVARCVRGLLRSREQARPPCHRFGNCRHGAEEMSDRCRTLFFAEAEMVGRRFRRRIGRHRSPLDGLERIETFRSERKSD